MTTDAQVTAFDPHPRRRISVLDTEMSYIDTGQGDPIVFLHGNPTWSYLWRNVIPHVSALGRCLAPDLVGMGQSGNSGTGGYRFVDHVRYLDAWFEALELTSNVTLVVHDWGSALGFHRATRYPDQIRGIAYMEAIVMSQRWEDFGDVAGVFRALRSPEGEKMVLDGNFFVEGILPRSILRKLSDGRTLEFCRTWPNQTEVKVRGVHFLQDDSPEEVGRALQDFVRSTPRRDR